jgi:hypothetical protein
MQNCQRMQLPETHVKNPGKLTSRSAVFQQHRLRRLITG